MRRCFPGCRNLDPQSAWAAQASRLIPRSIDWENGIQSALKLAQNEYSRLMLLLLRNCSGRLLLLLADSLVSHDVCEAVQAVQVELERWRNFAAYLFHWWVCGVQRFSSRRGLVLNRSYDLIPWGLRPQDRTSKKSCALSC